MDMTHIRLVKPSRYYIESYLEACLEFKMLGLLAYSFHDPDEYHIWGPDLFRRFNENTQGINLKEGFVPSTTFWLADTKNMVFIGEGNIRHTLTPQLERFGGHIGYAIRASLWNKGLGTLQLSLLLKEAAKLGITRALVTCNEENTGSIRVIEKNGGEYSDTVDNVFNGENIRTRRYFLNTM